MELKEQMLAYLDGEMHPKERVLFETNLATDNAMAQEIAFLIQAKSASLKLSKEKRKQNLVSRYSPKKAIAVNLKTDQKSGNWVMYAIAAGIALLALIWLGKSLLLTPPTHLDLYAQHFEMPSASHDRNNDLVNTWSKIIETYHSGDFQSCEKLLLSISPEKAHIAQAKIQFYLGAVYLMQNKNETAISTFQRIDSNSIFIQEAKWYLALAYLKANQLPDAKKQFMEIAASPNHYKQFESAKILTELTPK